ncbi:uncharacterized protein [Montipora foliosa]|uniref:uncharacterized protein isoform X2 n=1 Tax=Montipora foliosa TaxID=591990 RepID=UPI0035F144E2
MSKIKIFERYWSSSKGLSADLECIIFKSNASCSFWDKADYESIKQAPRKIGRTLPSPEVVQPPHLQPDKSQVTITPHFLSPVLVFEGEPLTLKWTFSIQGGSFRRVEFQTFGASVPIIEASLSGNPVTIDDRVSVNITATDVTIMFRTVDTKDSNNYTLVVLADGPSSGIADMKIIVQESQVTITPHFSSPVLVLEGRPVTLKWTYSIQGDSFRRVEFRISGASVPIIEESLSGNPFTFDDRVSVNITATYLTIMFRTVDTKDSNNYTLVVLANRPTSGTADMKIIVQVIGWKKISLRISTSGERDKNDSVWKIIESELVKVFADNQSYAGAELIADTRCGSLMWFDVTLRFNTQVAKDVIISKIQKGIVDDRLGVKVFPDIGNPCVRRTHTPKFITQEPEGDKTGIIVGGVLGPVALLVIIAVFYVWWKRND